MKKLLCILALFYLNISAAQTVSTFLQTNTNGCSGLTVDDNYLYVVSSFDGKVHRKLINSTDAAYETFDIGGSGYQGICKIGNYLYIAKPYNGNPGIYRFNPDSDTATPEYFLTINAASGLTSRNSELYISASDKIYKVDLTAEVPSLTQIAENISGSEVRDSTIGLKVYGDYLYLTETSGISKINLDSGNYEKETVSTFTGISLAIGPNGKFYLTDGSEITGVYELDTEIQTYSLFTEIDNFIGTFDVVFSSNSLFVTAREGNFNEVAQISLDNLNTDTAHKIKPVIFPNPAQDYINVTTLNPSETVTITNTAGQSKTIPHKNNKLDIADLSAGIYFIKTRNWAQRFIKK